MRIKYKKLIKLVRIFVIIAKNIEELINIFYTFSKTLLL